MSKYSLPFFKPWQGKGHAFIFEYGANGFFATSMAENPEGSEKAFNSAAKLTFKLGQADLGEILAVLSGRAPGIGKFTEGQNGKEGTYSGLFHKTDQYNAVMGIQENVKGGYSLSLSRKEGGNLTRHWLNLTLGEAQLLLEFFRSNIRDFFASDFAPRSENPQNQKTGNVPVNKTGSSPAKSSKVAIPATDDTPF